MKPTSTKTLRMATGRRSQLIGLPPLTRTSNNAPRTTSDDNKRKAGIGLTGGGGNSRPETGLLHPMPMESRLFLGGEKHSFLGIFLRAAGRALVRLKGVTPVYVRDKYGRITFVACFHQSGTPTAGLHTFTSNPTSSENQSVLLWEQFHFPVTTKMPNTAKFRSGNNTISGARFLNRAAMPTGTG